MPPRRFKLGFDECVVLQRQQLLPRIRTAEAAREVSQAILDGDSGASEMGETQEQAIERVAAALMSGELRVVRPDEWPRLHGRVPESAPLLSDLEPMDAVVEPLTWVGVRVVDQHGFPVPHLTAKLTLPDGRRHEQPLDAQARLRIDGLAGGDGEFDVRLVPPPLGPE